MPATLTGGPGATLTVTECTIVGKVHAKLIELASNSIFFARLGPAPGETWTAPVIAERRQDGLHALLLRARRARSRRAAIRCVPDADHPGRAAALHLVALRRSRLTASCAA